MTASMSLYAPGAYSLKAGALRWSYQTFSVTGGNEAAGQDYRCQLIPVGLQGIVQKMRIKVRDVYACGCMTHFQSSRRVEWPRSAK
jgi:hypothetical protein